ncbi:hypothetical protein ABEY41_08690 [Peribacillus butanolivorans]|uniref:hypothetical protein n=1 Tax=Peribacillus butanolivorans TaxID=421767 RepID=UPI003D2883DE
MEEAAIYDSQNNLVNFDFDKLENRFGKLEEFEILKNEINSSSSPGISTYAKQSLKSCMKDALKDHFGVALVEVAISGGL